jgi:hypothetical protein
MNDDILDILVAHGVPGTVIVRVAKLIADAEELQAFYAKQNEFKDHRASYMREYRVTARNSHVKSRKVTQPALSLREDLSKDLKKEPRRKTKTPLPADWQPIGDQRDPAEAEEFRDHARAKGYQYSDWNAAYRNYQRSPYNARNKNGAQPATDLAAGQAEWERYRQEQIREQLGGKGHPTGIRQNTGVGQKGPDDKGQLRPESGRTHGKTIECRQIADAISAVARNLRN